MDFYQLVKDLYEMNLSPFIANGSMTFSKYLPKNFPLDFKKKFFDEKRILGEHKTFGGLAIGLISGSISGYLGNIDFTYSFSSSLLAIIGDCLGSFIKRRFGKKEGEDFPLIDRTIWLSIYPFLYQYFNQKPINEFSILYLITLVGGYFLHKVTNKIKNYFL